MRFKQIFSKKKYQSTGWFKPEVTPNRKLDLIDDGVLAMAEAIKRLNERGIPFSLTTYSALISEYSRCARLNWSLTPSQRLVARKILRSRTSTADLETVLIKASKE